MGWVFSLRTPTFELMGLAAVVSSTSDGASAAITPTVSVGLATGGVFVAATLVVVLGYLNLLEASDLENEGLHRLLIATAVPLILTFVVIVLYESSTIIQP